MGATGEPESDGTGLSDAATSLSNGDDRGCHVSVRCRPLLQCDDRILMPDGLRALFSQVNTCLRHMFLSVRGPGPSHRAAFHDRAETLPDICPT
jgi:hypothetical protein